MIDKFPGKVSRVSGKIYFTPEQQRWLADALQWRTFNDVAKEVGVRWETISNYAKNHNIKRQKHVASKPAIDIAHERCQQSTSHSIFTPDPPSKCIGSKCWLFHRTDRTGSPLPCAKKGVCHAIF